MQKTIFIILIILLIALGIFPTLSVKGQSQNIVTAWFSDIELYSDEKNLDFESFTSANGRGDVNFTIVYDVPNQLLIVACNVTNDDTVDDLGPWSFHDRFWLLLDVDDNSTVAFDENDWLFLITRGGEFGHAQWNEELQDFIFNDGWPTTVTSTWINMDTSWLAVFTISVSHIPITDGQEMKFLIQQQDITEDEFANFPIFAGAFDPSSWATIIFSKRSTSIIMELSQTTLSAGKEATISAKASPSFSDAVFILQSKENSGEWEDIGFMPTEGITNIILDFDFDPDAIDTYKIRGILQGNDIYKDAMSETITLHHLTVNSPYGETQGGKWYIEGTLASFSVTDSIDHENHTRREFLGWTGDSSANTASGIVDMNSPKTVKAQWRTLYYLDILQGGGVVDKSSDWYEKGASVTVTATTPVKESDRSRTLFDSWSGDSTSSDLSVTITIDSPKTLIANWRNEYYLKVNSEYGDPQGEGWYEEGSIATFSVNSPQGALIQQVFQGWSGDVQSQHTTVGQKMNSPKTVTATWGTDYTQLIVIIMVVAAIVFVVLIMTIRRGKK